MSQGARRELAAWERLLRAAPPVLSLTRPVTRVARRYMSDASISVGLAGAWLDGDTPRIWHYVYSAGERAHIAATARSSGNNAASCAMLHAKTARADKTCAEILLELASLCTAPRP
jgi:hypothetical protein